ncbi:MAG: AAA family ATPase [Flavobacteriaceae bacterium]|nr:AAA family ATPase [Flavobacteriaceae bacterium]
MAKDKQFISERGRAKYFHGRVEQLDLLKSLLNETVQREEGSSLLFQGPPGVGKTALIEKCCEIARKKDWRVIELDNQCLHDPKDFFRRITQKKSLQDLKKEYGVDLSIIKFGMTPEKTEETNYLNESIVRAKSTLLYLDEAQTLGQIKTQEKRESIINFLRTYHNFQSSKGFILLFGGLSRTRETLESFGISRFSSTSAHYLEALDKEIEYKILKDWLTQEFQTPSNPEKWIDAITQRTEGWPRHLQSYVNAVNEYLDIGTSLKDHTLKKVLDFGDHLKILYYKDRCKGIPNKEKYLINMAIQSLPPHFEGEDFVSLLCENVPEEKADFLYERSLSKGIIHLDDNDVCSIPIPSLRTYLKTHHNSPRLSPENYEAPSRDIEKEPIQDKYISPKTLN